MSHEHRRRAQEQLTAFLALLQEQPEGEQLAHAIELGQQLHRAIESYHMEAIRFRMFTLGRELTRLGDRTPPAGPTLYEGIRASLEAAGFHTRSITS